MSIEREYGTFYVQCDMCAYNEGELDSHAQAVNFARNAPHWHIRREGDEYYDVCESCWQSYASSLIEHRGDAIIIDFGNSK